jgi:hypothetical protein
MPARYNGISSNERNKKEGTEMTQFEMVEMLREKANVSYEEAKAALEKADWELLEAMLVLEKEGRVNAGSDEILVGEYTTRRDKKTERTGKDKGTLGDKLGRFGRWLARMVAIGNANTFEIQRNGEKLLTISVTTLAILAVFTLPLTVILVIVGFFFGFKYSFHGPNFGREAINNAIDRAASMADDVKREFKEKRENSKAGKTEDAAVSGEAFSQTLGEAASMAEELKQDV